MGSITAVEIGADTCALASTAVHKAELRVHAAETLDPAAFPGIEAFTQALQQTRRSLKLPRACRAVVWGLPDGARRADPAVAPLIEPLIRAGFRVKRVVTPCNALGALSRLRTSRTGGAMCWVGINRNGVAIVVIRPGKLLYSHSFAWDSNVGASGSQARLLQRYSLVAFLAPEVRRAVAAAKQKGTTVDGIVTCGNLPDLRALTMPLIEELDIEVETLDSLEGLVMKPELADKLAEVAPAIRLACAGALARESRTVDESKRGRVRGTSRLVQALGAAAAIGLLAAGYWWYLAPRFGAKPTVNTATANLPPKAASTRPVQSTPPSGPPAPAPSASAPAARTATVAAPTATPGVTKTAPPTAAVNGAAPGAHPPSSRPSTTPSAAPAGAQRSNAAVPVAPPSLLTKSVTSPRSAPERNIAAPPPVNPARSAADKPEAAVAQRGSEKPHPALLTDPVPKVTAILLSADRRLATVGDDGHIVGVGDTLGRRVVVAIDDRTVLFREPSGAQIRVALGGRVVGVEWPGRQQ